MICYLPPFMGTRNNHWYTYWSYGVTSKREISQDVSVFSALGWYHPTLMILMTLFLFWRFNELLVVQDNSRRTPRFGKKHEPKLKWHIDIGKTPSLQSLGRGIFICVWLMTMFAIEWCSALFRNGPSYVIISTIVISIDSLAPSHATIGCQPPRRCVNARALRRKSSWRPDSSRGGWSEWMFSLWCFCLGPSWCLVSHHFWLVLHRINVLDGKSVDFLGGILECCIASLRIHPASTFVADGQGWKVEVGSFLSFLGSSKWRVSNFVGSETFRNPNKCYIELSLVVVALDVNMKKIYCKLYIPDDL